MKKDIKQSPVAPEKNAQFLGYGKNDVAMFAIDQFSGNVVGPVSLVGGTTGIAKSGFASKGYKFDTAAMGTGIHAIAIGGVAARQRFFNLFDDNRPHIWVLLKEAFPMVLKYLLDCKLAHANIISEFAGQKSITQDIFPHRETVRRRRFSCLIGNIASKKAKKAGRKSAVGDWGEKKAKEKRG